MSLFFKRKHKTDKAVQITENIKTAEKEFKYLNEVFLLNEQVNNEVNSLLKEESEITNGLNTLFEGAEFTTKQIGEVEEYLINLSQNSENTMKCVDMVVDSMKQSELEVDTAKNSLDNIVSEMDGVSEVFEQFYAVFIELQAQYKNLSEFANIINDVANQTNLLSLNASIEAARAGEAGKGFAVVAQEIKKLSSSTEQNSKDIIDSLGKMTDTIEKLSNKSNEGKKLVSNTTNSVKETGVQFKNITEAEQKVFEQVKVVQASQQQNIGTVQEITATLESIEDKSKTENNELEELILSVQKKADFYQNILNHLNQIKILENEK